MVDNSRPCQGLLAALIVMTVLMLIMAVDVLLCCTVCCIQSCRQQLEQGLCTKILDCCCGFVCVLSEQGTPEQWRAQYKDNMITGLLVTLMVSMASAH